MNPIRSVKNQYRGVNAHLHSYLQKTASWKKFHGNYITFMLAAMQAALIPMGYLAQSDSSLQIRLKNTSLGEPESDLAIYDRDPLRPSLPLSPLAASEGVLVMSAPAAIAPHRLQEKPFRAISIYRLVPDEDIGEPVAWIEVLSPTNKGEHDDARVYQSKREKLIMGGVVFVEIDFLHETPPTFYGLPDYHTHKRRRSQPDAHPYRIAIVDPRPTFDDGKVYIKEFDVDDPIPSMTIPLNGDDVLHFDFGAPYKRTYEEIMLGMTYVDYARFPERFERYSEADQARIARRMLAVHQAYQSGQNLEGDPLPVDDIPLETALEAVRALLPETTQKS